MQDTFSNAQDLKALIESGLDFQAKLDSAGVGGAGARNAVYKTAIRLLSAKDAAVATLIIAAYGVEGEVRVEVEGPVSAALYSVYRGERLIGSLEVYTAGMTGSGQTMGCGLRLIVNQGYDGESHEAH